MEIRCVIKEEISTKTGKPYTFIYIPDIEKKVFLEPAELKLLALLYKKN